MFNAQSIAVVAGWFMHVVTMLGKPGPTSTPLTNQDQESKATDSASQQHCNSKENTILLVISEPSK